jgi:hypothetical protein
VELPYERELDGYFDSPEDAPAGWLLMMRAYIDESGHEGKGWMFLAGYLGNEDHWRSFVSPWKTGLGPQRKSLHMTELRWNQDRTKRLLARLGPIPEACGLTPLLAGVRYSDYEDLVSGTPAAKLLKGYLACLFPLILQTLRVVPNTERLEVVFEEQREYEPFAQIVLSQLAVPDHPWKRTLDGLPKLAKWAFVPKGTTIMTDPADYFAFALREVWTDKTSKKSEWCQPILKSDEGIGKILRRQEVRDIISTTFMMATFDDTDRRIAKLYLSKKAEKE